MRQASTSRQNDTATLLDTVPCLPTMIQRIVDRFDPLKIILFGSWARGDTHRWSDVDLLVVLADAPDKRQATIAALSELRDLTVPVDVIVTDIDEIARRGTMVGTVLRPALREGKVVYERS